MASLFSHAVAAASIGVAFPPPKSSRFWAYGIICSIIPDADVVGFRIGIEYGDMLGHRGLTHSIAFAAGFGAMAAKAIAAAEPQTRFRPLWLYLFLAMISHGLLDALTNGGLGVAFFSPFVTTRYFFPWDPIEVSPIGVKAFFSNQGLAVIQSEAVWIWLPSLAFAAVAWWLRRTRSRLAAASTSGHAGPKQ